MRDVPSLGPPFDRSYTCLGLSIYWNLRKMRSPWRPPLLGFTKTSSGQLNSSGGVIWKCVACWWWCICDFYSSFTGFGVTSGFNFAGIVKYVYTYDTHIYLFRCDSKVNIQSTVSKKSTNSMWISKSLPIVGIQLELILVRLQMESTHFMRLVNWTLTIQDSGTYCSRRHN